MTREEIAKLLNDPHVVSSRKRTRALFAALLDDEGQPFNALGVLAGTGQALVCLILALERPNTPPEQRVTLAKAFLSVPIAWGLAELENISNVDTTAVKIALNDALKALR